MTVLQTAYSTRTRTLPLARRLLPSMLYTLIDVGTDVAHLHLVSRETIFHL